MKTAGRPIVHLNDEPLRGPQPLHPGDRIRIGDSDFTFER